MSQPSESKKPFQQFNESESRDTMPQKYLFYISEMTENRGLIDVPDPVIGESEAQVMSIYNILGKKIRINRKVPITSENAKLDSEPQPVPENNEVLGDQQSSSPTIKPNQTTERRLTLKGDKDHYYSVNGEQFKTDSFGQLWQLSWENVENTDTIRIISTRTNKPIDLTGKIIQIKRWKRIQKNDEPIMQFRDIDSIVSNVPNS